MKPILLGLVLGVLISFPALGGFLLEAVLGIVAALVSQPVVLAVAAGIWGWPHITGRVRRWAR